MIRVLERCCICEAYFLPRDSALKRRAHMEQCARFAHVSPESLTDRVNTAAAQVLGAMRAHHEHDNAKRTLLRRMEGRGSPDKRIVRLSAILGPRLEACALAGAADEHRAVRDACDAYLQRLCVTPCKHQRRRARRRGRCAMYDAALSDTVSLERLAADIDRTPSPYPPQKFVRRRSMHSKSVPTSDDECDTR